MRRRDFLGLALVLPCAAATAGEALRGVTVAKTPSCGCCTAWVEHMRAAGFEVAVQDVSRHRLDRLKRRIGLARKHASCHTAAVEGYVIEGHVPAGDVQRLLDERPAALGLAVPGMPVGSPGMEMGDRREPFDTLLVGADGSARIFERHR